MTALVFHIARPWTLWALHFVAIYALVSAACAPRALLDPATMRAMAAAVTGAAAILALVWLIQGRRTVGRLSADAPQRPLAVAAMWSAALALLAILVDVWPIAAMSRCTG